MSVYKRRPKHKIQDMTGKSALHYAAKTACREIVELLLENSARIIIGDQDYTGFSALHWAIEGASLEILILILRFSSPED
jgi:ankyrin repeat protein